MRNWYGRENEYVHGTGYWCHVRLLVYVHEVECFISAFVGNLQNATRCGSHFLALSLCGLLSLKNSKKLLHMGFSHSSGAVWASCGTWPLGVAEVAVLWVFTRLPHVSSANPFSAYCGGSICAFVHGRAEGTKAGMVVRVGLGPDMPSFLG